MRAADLVQRIWGAPSIATSATSATSATTATKKANRPDLSQLSQLSQGVRQGNCPPPVASVATVARGGATQIAPANDAAQIAPRLADLLAQHGGYHAIDWAGLALTDAQKSSLWIVQRPDGVLTTLATVEPIQKPLSYRQAWPARFTSAEPVEDAPAPAAEAAAQIVQTARQICWGCRHLDTSQKPTCGCAKE
ncbi:MAG: hypothetical protein KGL33_02110 [Betaproteobacteria bacterium]|nr:hypothetical protein [Betaproteobacteria bacterium]